MNYVREKNPFFLPALLMTLIPIVAGVRYYTGSGMFFTYELASVLRFLMFTTPFAAIFLSVAGKVHAEKRQKTFIGCIFCLVLLILEIVGFICYLS